MDFDLSEEQRELRRSIQRFCRERLVDPSLGARDHQGTFSRALWSACGEMGLPGLVVPAALGGAGVDMLSAALVFETLGTECEDGGLVFSLGAHLFACVVPIWRSGHEDQHRRWLPGLCDGSLIAANAMTEPGSGSDAFAMTTRADPDGDGFRLSGVKTFCTNAPVADVFLTFAATDPGKGFHGGITAFLVEAGGKGVTVTRPMEKMGLRTSPLGELHLDEAAVPASAVIGEVGTGATEFTRAMDWERTGIFAAHVGVMERLLRRGVEHARARVQSGQPIGKFQAVSHRLADLRVQLEAARLLVYRSAWRLGRGRTATLEAAMAKLYASEALVKAALDTVQVFGGYGYMAEMGIERVLRDAVAGTIYSGTSEIQRNMIARWMGL